MKLTDFLAADCLTTKEDLFKTYHELPAGRRIVSPGGEARSPLNMMAEIAMMFDMAMNLMRTGAMKGSMDDFEGMLKSIESKGEASVLAMIESGAAKFSEVLREFPEDELEESVELPWGNQSKAEVANYPIWNMRYHQGQLSLVRSLGDR
ncbi:MAG: hypothetical protein C4320_03445 [Armatimonadota bacterium]